MSLFNLLQTSVSGMAAQATALSTIGDNIANSATTGYKEATAQFQTLLGQNSGGTYESGGVQTDVRYGITDQGTLSSTTSPTDLAVNGNGFFVVSQGGQGTYMTRAGSFVPDSNGNLVNAAGFQLMGYAISSTGITSATLTPVNVASSGLQYAESTTGTLSANLPSTKPAVTDDTLLPSNNQTATAQYTAKTSITTYDKQGTPDILDIYLTKTDSNTWEATAYQQSDASAATGGFPYANGNVGTVNMTFDPTSGSLMTQDSSGNALPGATLNVTMASGDTVAIDTSGMTQLATDFGVTANKANGNAPSKVSSVSVGKDGTLTEDYASGVQVATYEIPLATVTSADNLTPLSGNVYQVSEGSGPMILSAAGTNGTGAIDSDTLEQSTVDLASELTNMIQAQRAYEANSKVLQAGSDLLGVLNRLSTS